MANKRVVELDERTTIQLADWLLVDDTTGTRKLSMARLLSYLSYSAIIFVAELPTTDINPNMLYLVPHTGSVTEFDEYVYRDSQWNLLGVSVLDLTAVYQTLTDDNLQTTSKAVVGAINELVTSKLNASKFTMDGNTLDLAFADNKLKITYKLTTTVWLLVQLSADPATDGYKMAFYVTNNSGTSWSNYWIIPND